ncbi:MAG TPA: autotransporter domain-containing protein [Aliidongia sp.]|uniref:autotransporter domain-containing protein n=1 Tax=Aliidongia sp. TaxID=1914230 RepID=UPI002DDD5AF8|nr:autotransporter domain-containing protein [Aliidongia sp.]HEV2674661.1 autotransporter domain-containing protein [Aliidongia sp.]
MRAFIAGIGVSLAVLSGSADAESRFSNIVVVGDSVSDNGNIPKDFSGQTPLASTFPISPPYYGNRFSNGPIYVDYLNGLLGVKAPLVDVAIGGAFTGVGNVLPTAIIPAGQGGMASEIDALVASGTRATSKSLYVVFGGANDYFGFLGGAVAAPGLSATQVTNLVNTQVQTTVGNLVTDVTRLYGLGVRYFVVPNLQDLGNTPSYNTSAERAIASQVSVAHNAALQTAMAALAQQLHVTIVMPDNYAADQAIENNPAKFGFTNVTTACKAGTTGLAGTVCATPDTYRYWDSVHPTAAAHILVADVFVSTINGPLAIGAEGELGIIAIQSTFDAITSRTQALRDGASGLTFTDVNGQSGGTANPDKPLAGFVTGSYGWGSRDDRSSASGFDYTTKNIYGGLDYKVTPNLVLGALFGYGTTEGTLHGSMGEADFDSYQGAVYATYFNGGFYATLGGTYVGNDWTKLSRNTFLAGQTTQATAKGQSGGLKVETGYAFNVGGFNVGPVGELRWANIGIDGYSEHGVLGLNQQIDEQSFQTLIGAFGGQVSFTTDLGGLSVSPHLRLTYDHEFKDSNRSVNTRLVSEPLLTVTTALDDPGKDSVRIGGGIDIALGDSLTALVDFNATAARSDGNDYQTLAKLRYSF